MTIYIHQEAPISAADRQMLRDRLLDLEGAAKAKGTMLDAWEKRDESAMGDKYFELGCWLWYYRDLAYRGTTDERVECARRIFMFGLNSPGYSFFTAFDFGERQFDSLFESGDAEAVIRGLRAHLARDRTGKLKSAFAHFGWPLVVEEEKSVAQVAIDPRQIGLCF